MADGNVANAYADIRADSSKLDGDLAKAKSLLLQRVRELEQSGKIPLTFDQQLFRAGLDTAAAEARSLAAGGIILPVNAELNDTLAREEIANLQSQRPIIDAQVLVNESAAIAAISEIESLAPIIPAELIVDDANAIAVIENVDSLEPIVDVLVRVDQGTIAAINSQLGSISESAAAAGASIGQLGVNDGATLAALDAAGLTGLYQNVKVSVDAATGSIRVAKAANTEYAVGVDVLNEGLASELALEVATAKALYAKQQAALAASTGETQLAATTSATNATLSTSQLGFTRLGGSIALVGGQLLGLPPLLNLTLAVLGRDVVKIATKQLDSLALSIGNTKKAAAATSLTTVADTRQAEQIGLDRLHTEAEQELALAISARQRAQLVLSSTNEEVLAAELLVTEGTTGRVGADVLVAEAEAARAAATTAVIIAEVDEAAATATAATAAEIAAQAEVTLAAARAAATAAAEAETVAAFSSTTILIGLAVVVAAAAVAYKLFADDGSQKRIADATNRTSDAFEKQIETLQKAGGAAATAGSQFADSSLGFETFAKAITAGVSTKEIDKFNSALVETGTSLSRLPELQAAVFAPGKTDLAALFPTVFAEIPDKYHKLFSDVLQEERNFDDAKLAIDTRISQRDGQNLFVEKLSTDTQASLDAVHEIINQLDNIDISSAFTKTLNSLQVNGTILEQQVAKSLADALAAGTIQIQDAIDTLNNLFKKEALDAKTFDIRKNQLIDEAALDPNAIKIYREAISGAIIDQAALNEITTKFGLDPVDALAAGKIAYDDNTKAIADQEKATAKAAEEDAKRREAEFKKNQEAAQKIADSIAEINGLIGTGDSAITGLIVNVGLLNDKDLENLKTNLTNLNSATDSWATSITQKLFPTLDSLFGDKLTKKGKVAFADLTKDIEKNLFVSQTIFNEQQFIDPTKFANTLKTFGDIVANEGPTAAQKFFDAFRTATPEQRTAFETAAKNSQDAFQLDTEKFKAEGQAIGAAIAPEIIKAINAALELANLGDPITGAVNAAIISAGKSPGDRDDNAKGKAVTSASDAAYAAQVAYQATLDANPTTITIEPDLTPVDGALGGIEETPITVSLLGNTSDIIGKLHDGFSTQVAVSASAASLALLRQQIRDATSQAGKWMGGDLAAGERSWVNEMGPEGWLPKGASLDKMTIIGGGAPWRDFIAPGPGTVIDHRTTERVMRNGGGAAVAMAISNNALVSELHELAKMQREIVAKQQKIASGPPQVHVHTNAKQPHAHGAAVFWAYKNRVE